MRVILDKFPIPPSENHAYPTIQTKYGKSIRITGKELKEFKKEVEYWAWNRIIFVKEIQKRLSDLIARDQTTLIRVDGVIGFKLDRLYTKHKTRKKMDSSNRIKAAHDALSGILGIDDRYFYCGEFMPSWIEQGEEECMILTLTTTTMSAMKKIRMNLHQKQVFSL